MGVSFDRAATIPATDARIEDARRKRSIAAHRAINDALSELDRLHQPCRVVGVVGGTNAGVHEKVLPRPPAAERQTIVRNFNTLISTHMTLVEADLGSDSTDRARSVLGDLHQKLTELCAVDEWLGAMTPEPAE
jgi:hypothetical protein